MADANSAVLVVSSQEYVPSSAQAADAPDWIVESFISDGWEAIGAETRQIAVEFVDGRSAASGGGDYPQIEGIAKTATMPVVARVRVPVRALRFRRRNIYCSAEVADIGEDLARTWASQVTQQGASGPIVDVGVGRADEKNATLTTGELLIRVDLWEEGAPGASLYDAASSRTTAQGILDALATAGAR